MTTEQLVEAINIACPHCKAGNAPRLRYDTKEYVHDFHAVKSDILTPSLAGQGGPTVSGVLIAPFPDVYDRRE